MDSRTTFLWRREELSSDSPVITDRFGTRAVLVGHFIILTGVSGRTLGSMLNLQRKCWTLVPKSAENAGFYLFLHTANLFNDQILFTGLREYHNNWQIGEKLKEIYALDLISWEFEVKPAFGRIPQHTNETTAHVYEERRQLVSYGGSSSQADQGNEILRVLDLDRMIWYIPETSGNKPGPRFRHGSCIANHALFVLGGKTGRGYSSSLHSIRLDSSQYIWHLVQTSGYMEQYRLTAGLVSAGGGKLIVWGGYSSNRASPFLVLEEAFSATPVWCSVKTQSYGRDKYIAQGTPPKPRESPSVLVNGSRLLVLPTSWDDYRTCYFELSIAKEE